MVDILGTAAKTAYVAGQPEVAAVIEAVSTVKKVLEQLADSMLSFVEKSNPGLFKETNLALDNLSAAFGRLFEPLVMTFVPILNKMNEFFTSLIPAFEEFYGAIFKTLGPLLDLGMAIANVFILPSKLLMKLASLVLEVLNPFIATIDAVVSTLLDAFTAIFDLIVDGVINPLMELLRPVLDWLTSTLKTLVSWFRAFIEVLVELLGGTMKSKGMTQAVSKGEIVGIEDLGKQFRDASLSFGGGAQGQTQMSMFENVAKIKEVIYDVLKPILEAYKTAKDVVVATKDAVTSGSPGMSLGMSLGKWYGGL